MCKSHKPELDLDFSVRLQSEALEAVILLDVAEDRLWLYWTIASVIETAQRKIQVDLQFFAGLRGTKQAEQPLG